MQRVSRGQPSSGHVGAIHIQRTTPRMTPTCHRTSSWASSHPLCARVSAPRPPNHAPLAEGPVGLSHTGPFNAGRSSSPISLIWLADLEADTEWRVAGQIWHLKPAGQHLAPNPCITVDKPGCSSEMATFGGQLRASECTEAPAGLCKRAGARMNRSYICSTPFDVMAGWQA
jgi:hypothetical protein